jgi:hypothetical protein
LSDSELVVEILDRDWEEAIAAAEPALRQKLETATMGTVKTLSFTRQ